MGPRPVSDKQKKKSATSDAFEDWSGAKGLAEDVRRYGHWMREEAFKRIGHLYPKVTITQEMVAERPDLKVYIGESLTVIAWLWARTVKSPNPAFSHVDVPLASSFVLSSKKGKEAWVQPVVDGDHYQFAVQFGTPPAEAKNGTSAGKWKAFKCLMSDAAISYDYIKAEAQQKRMGERLMAIVLEGKKGRVYLTPNVESEQIAREARPSWKPTLEINYHPRDIKTQIYGLTQYGDLFTPRQLVALTTFSDLVQEARNKAIADAKASGLQDDGKGLEQGGLGATAYGDAIAVYLTFSVDRSADFNNSLTGWRQGNEKIMYLFARQAIPMAWDFGEANIMENVVGGFITNLEYQAKCLLKLGSSNIKGAAFQLDAAAQDVSRLKVISTDPPVL